MNKPQPQHFSRRQTPAERYLLVTIKRLEDNVYATTAPIPEFPLVLSGAAADAEWDLIWPPVPGAKRYQIYRSSGTFDDADLIGTIEEQGVISMRTFRVPVDMQNYWVRAIDDNDEGPISNETTTA